MEITTALGYTSKPAQTGSFFLRQRELDFVSHFFFTLRTCSNEVSAPDAVFSVHDILGQLDHQREEQAKAERTDKAIQSVVMQDKGIEVHAYRAAAV